MTASSGSGGASVRSFGSGADVASLAWCDRCGEALDAGSHDTCAAARALEPPRYCAHCRRRMKVQVFPQGWRATCVEHGEIATV